ncbi:hypothetical protein CT0861_00869 [Colletotrichum tofieldiae]|uniref:MADS-box domain-containing protein n=1 Tax=Colletotrichum tofieldiae TaxID=708197 RepID=A0A161W8R4_9PEZI|nr:hypothetical protein CT0861_00869 [Colletotrichum tofieldiae]
MDTLPIEIITHIASFMKVGDLSNFRLAHSHLANVTFRLLAKHLRVLNVVDDLRDLVAFVSAKDNGYYTEAVTLLHGRWPICDFDEWVAHPLQLNEFLPQTPSTTRRRQDAFMNYRTFAENEAHRDTDSDLAKLKRALSFLPKLRHLTVSHIHTKGWKPVGPQKYLALRKRIWMAPYINDSIGETSQNLFRLLPSLSSVQQLSMEGRLDPSFISIAAPITQITILELKAVQLYDPEGQSLLSLLHAFPSLKELSLGFISTEIMAPVDEIHLKSLSKLHLHPTSIDISVEDEKSRLLTRFLEEQGNPARCFRTRRDGLIFKAHTLQSLVPDAKVAVFTFFEGRLYSYQSHDNWPVNPFELKGMMVLPDDQKLPDHFTTVTVSRESRQGSSASGSSTTTKSEAPDDVISMLDIEDPPPYPTHDRANTTTSGLETTASSRAATPLISSSVERLPTSSPSSSIAKRTLPSSVARGYEKLSSTTLSGGVRKATCAKTRVQDLPPRKMVDNTMWWINVKTNAPGLPGLLLEENTLTYNPAQNIPQLLMVVGASRKRGFLRRAYPKVSWLETKGHFNFVECDKSTALLDCNLLADLPRAQGGPLPGHVIRHCLESVRQTPTAALQVISARLFYPFASTLVFFADDFGGPEDAADILANWVTTSQQATIPPHLFVITESTVPSKAFMAMVKSKMMCFTLRKAPESPSSPTEAERMLMRHFANVTLISPSNYKYRPQTTQKHRLTGLHLGRLFDLAIHQLLQNEPFDLLKAWRSLYPSPIQAGLLLTQICTEAMERGIDPLGVASSSLASDPLVHHLPADYVFTSYEKEMVDVEVLCRKHNLPDQFRREFCERANETMPTTRPWEADTTRLSAVVGLPSLEISPSRKLVGSTKPTKRIQIRRRLGVKGGFSLRSVNQHQCCVAYMNDSSKCYGNYVPALEGLEALADFECNKAWPSAQSYKVHLASTQSRVRRLLVKGFRSASGS